MSSCQPLATSYTWVWKRASAWRFTLNPNDLIRERILRYFYERNRSARSFRGRGGAQVRIGDVKRDLKAIHGLSQAEVISNLTYLLDNGWVSRNEERRTFRTRNGTEQPSVVDWYAISAAGIDRIEADTSSFRPKTAYDGINITANGSAVVIGDGNVVNQRHMALWSELDGLEKGIRQSSVFTDADKLSVIADIETLKEQLAKPEPEPGVVNTLWTQIERFVVGSQFAEYAARIGPFIAGLST